MSELQEQLLFQRGVIEQDLGQKNKLSRASTSWNDTTAPSPIIMVHYSTATELNKFSKKKSELDLGLTPGTHYENHRDIILTSCLQVLFCNFPTTANVWTIYIIYWGGSLALKLLNRHSGTSNSVTKYLIIRTKASHLFGTCICTKIKSGNLQPSYESLCKSDVELISINLCCLNPPREFPELIVTQLKQVSEP